jgi:hypothetical protein
VSLTPIRRTAAPAVALMAALAAPGAARAETTACLGVGTLPATISASGHYCLGADVDVAGDTAAGITINTSDVVLDCNGRRMRSTSADNTGVGIYIASSARRVTVRNCRIEDFGFGVSTTFPVDGKPRDLRILGNHVSGASRWGIAMYGSGIQVEGNHVVASEGSASGYNPGGIDLEGYSAEIAAGNVVRGNTVADFKPEFPGGSCISAGIQFSYQQGIVVEDNTVSGLYARTGCGVYGINGALSTGASVRGNTVLSAPPLPAPFDGGNWVGIFLQGGSDVTATHVCVDNRVGNFSSNLTGCGNQANNTTF